MADYLFDKKTTNDKASTLYILLEIKNYTMNRKTVFILGAGFSYPAGIPSQGQLLSSIYDYELNPELEKCRTNLTSFIKAVFGLDKEQIKNIDLEDIYTPIHQSVKSGGYLKGYSPSVLAKIQNQLNLLIAHVIDNPRLGTELEDEYINLFVERLIEDKAKDRTDRDRAAIISLNWDILLDKKLFELIPPSKGTVDYACHCAGYKGGASLEPAMKARGAGKYTIKLMKLHGSLSWLSCPSCNRLFINKHKKIGIEGFKQKAGCHKCEKVILDPEIILPTFQKEFNKLHFQMIWNQAGIELFEATKIVFIGYSFPLADFDFRSLITRYARKDVEVDVVLTNDDSSKEAADRYRAYFGCKINEVYLEGVVDYINKGLVI